MFCPKCGTQVPDNAAFCPNCNHQFAATRPAAQPRAAAPSANAFQPQPLAGMAPQMATTNKQQGLGLQIMPIVRIVLSIIVLLSLFLMPWATYQGAISGTHDLSLENLTAMKDLFGVMRVAMIAAAVSVIVAEVINELAHVDGLRIVSLVAALAILILAVITAINCLQSGQVYGYTVARITPSVGPIVTAVLSIAMMVTCFMKR